MKNIIFCYILSFVFIILLRLIRNTYMSVKTYAKEILTEKHQKQAAIDFAYFRYDLVMSAYESMLIARNKYYQSHFILDQEKQSSEKAYWKKKYNDSIAILENPENEEVKQYLSPGERKTFEHTLSLPRYKLF